jgi:membrane protease YdiL (CAAX protease family)
LINYTYHQLFVWDGGPSPPKPEPHPFRRCAVLTLWVTLPPLLLFLLIGLWLGYQQGGWTGAEARVLNWKILLAFACYLPWALMQQTLFQFYLLGRLLALFPKVPPLALATVTDVAYALVHLPDLWTMLVTIFGGVVWSWFYYRYRSLLPLACSHAALGSAFYYWVYGHDLAAEWGRLFQ